MNRRCSNSSRLIFSAAATSSRSAANVPKPQRVMPRDRHVMLFELRCSGKTHMTAGLARRHIPEVAESPGEILTRDVAWQSHTTMTCSRVKCSRTTRGYVVFIEVATDRILRTFSSRPAKSSASVKIDSPNA